MDTVPNKPPACPPALSRHMTDELLQACHFQYSREEVQRALQLAGRKLVQAALLLGSSSTYPGESHCIGPRIRIVPKNNKTCMECALCLSDAGSEIYKLPCGTFSCIEVKITCICGRTGCIVRVSTRVPIFFAR